jgi:hypothetical protein
VFLVSCSLLYPPNNTLVHSDLIFIFCEINYSPLKMALSEHDSNMTQLIQDLFVFADKCEIEHLKVSFLGLILQLFCLGQMSERFIGRSDL